MQTVFFGGIISIHGGIVVEKKEWPSYRAILGSEVVKTTILLYAYLWLLQCLAMAEKATISYKAFQKMEEEYP